MKAKISRIRAAVQLKEHDRVPLMGNLGYWPVKYINKYTMQQAYYDGDVFATCYGETLERWHQWDAMVGSINPVGPMLDATGSTRLMIPGRDLSPDADHQHPDASFMGEDEYDCLTEDPINFQLETVLPRVCKRMGADNFLGTIKAVAKVALYSAELAGKRKRFWADMRERFAVPSLTQGGILIMPVDWIADSLRGFNQGLIDVKMRPGKVADACEALIPLMLNLALASVPSGSAFPFIYNPQHVSPFISQKDYRRVYWPAFSTIVDEITRRGNVVWTVFEGVQDQHLECLQDLPRGKFVAHFEGTDLEKAKKVLGGKICVAGGMPNSLLARGTPSQVEERTITVLKLFEDEPGFIMAADAGLNSARPENIDAWLKAMRTYGGLGGALDVLDDELSDDSGSMSADFPPGTEKLITRWDTVRPEFGDIPGDEQIIKENWERLEIAILGILHSLVR